jgi:hypothetical protein
MRRTLVVLLVLVALLIAADLFAKNVAEEQIAKRLRRTFDLASEPSVSVRGIPFLLNLLQGEISSVGMVGDRVRSEDVTLNDVKVEIDEIRFSLSDVVDGSGDVRASGGRGSAAVTQANLNGALEGAGAPAAIDLADAAEVVSLEGNALSVAAPDGRSIALDLPTLGGRVRYESLEVKGGVLSLSFTVEELEVSA